MLLFTAAAQAVQQDGYAGAQQEREYAHQDITVGSALTQHPGGAGGGNMQRDRCACPAGHGKAQRLEGMSYSQLMGALHKAGIEINRKVLADLAMNHPEAFKAVVAKIK